MGFKLGGKSKTTTTSNSTTNSTTSPVAPEWASSLTQGVAGRVGGLLSVDPASLVAPAHGLQQQAANAAQGLSASPWNYDAAADLTRGAANTSWLDPYMAGGPFRASDNVGSYLNPYLSEVVDSSAADFDANAGQVRAQQALDLAGAGAFGGSGAALTQSMTEGELSRARSSALSGLRSHAYDTALGFAASDADRALQDRSQRVGYGFQAQQQQLAAANQLASLSSQLDADRRANIATQAGLGETLRGIDTEQRRAPVENTQQLVAMLSGLPINLFTGQQTNTTESSTGTSKTKNAPGAFDFYKASLDAGAQIIGKGG